METSDTNTKKLGKDAQVVAHCISWKLHGDRAEVVLPVRTRNERRGHSGHPIIVWDKERC